MLGEDEVTFEKSLWRGYSEKKKRELTHRRQQTTPDSTTLTASNVISSDATSSLVLPIADDSSCMLDQVDFKEQQGVSV